MVVCGFGYGSSKLLAQKLLERYDVNILSTLPYHKFLEIDNYDDIDLIISTLDVDDKLDYPFPIIKVSPLFSKDDRKKLEEYGLTEVRKKISLSKLLFLIKEEAKIIDEDKLANKLKEFLSAKVFDDRDKLQQKGLEYFLEKNNIKLKCKAKDWMESIRIAGELLLKNNSIDSEYIEHMVEAVKTNGSYMIVANKIALPHARVSDSILKTDMSLISLKDEVTFPGDKKVKLILTFSSLDQREHIEALAELVLLIEEYNFVNFVEKVSDPSLILDFIREKNEDATHTYLNN